MATKGITIDSLTYGRSASGRKKLINELNSDIDRAVTAMTKGKALENIKTVIDKYWVGADANKFYSQLKQKSTEASKALTKYKSIISSALVQDARSFEKMQTENATRY